MSNKTLAFAAVLVAMVAIAAAGTPSFTVCNAGEALLQDVKITHDGAWASDKEVSFTISGRLTGDIPPGATTSTLAYFSGYEVENSTDDLCSYEGSPFECPEDAGEHTWTFPFQIPSIPYAGELTSHSEFRNPDGALILCLDLSVKL